MTPQTAKSDHDLLIRLDQKVDGIVDTLTATQVALEKATITYATKPELDSQKKRIDAIMAFGGAILLAVTVALVIAFVRLAGAKI